MALALGSWRGLVEIEKKRASRWYEDYFARAAKLGNCPEIYVPLGGTGFAARRLHSNIISVWLRETVRMWGIF